jgi:hypothetical protein
LAPGIEQVVAIEFDGIKEVREISNEQRTARVSAIVKRVYRAAAVAAEIIALDRTDLVQIVREKYEMFGPSLMEFLDASRDVEMLRDFIKSAEARLVVRSQSLRVNRRPTTATNPGERRGVTDKGGPAAMGWY